MIVNCCLALFVLMEAFLSYAHPIPANTRFRPTDFIMLAIALIDTFLAYCHLTR